MAIVRPITTPEVPKRLQATGVTVTGSYGFRPCYLSRDRTTFFATSLSNNIQLYQSGNGGGTWVLLHSFAEQVLGMVETDDGEVLVATQAGASSPGYIYKSSGWTASHTGATWTKTLTTLGGYIRPIWSLHPWSIGANGVVVTNEYGPQTTAAGDQTAKARRVFLSTNFGATWTTIFDIFAPPVGTGNLADDTSFAQAGVPLHVHASAYDPEWDRIWITFGDAGTALVGTGYNSVAYSDDHGVTWHKLPLADTFQASIQPTSIAILEEALLMMPDGEPYGVQVYPKVGFRQMGPMRQANLFGGNTGAQAISLGPWRNYGQRGAPLMVGMLTQSGNLNNSPALYACTDGGLTWTELWRDDTNRVANQGVNIAVGPDIAGVVLADYTTKANSLLKFNVLAPESGAAPSAALIENVNAASVSGAVALPDVSSFTEHLLTLTGDTTLTFPPAGAGKSFKLALLQDATGAHVVTWPGNVKWPGGAAPAVTAAANKTDFFTFRCLDGTNWIAAVEAQNL